jgi:hypothetical protein
VRFVISTGILCLAGCMPAHLSKYSKNEKTARPPVSELLGESADRKSPTPPSTNVSTPSVYAIDAQTYRFLLSRDEVWEALIDVLMKNYNLTILDRESGIITTEWDSFVLSDVIYRNKLSVRLRPSGRKSVDVMIHNNVERLERIAGQVSGAWLPSDEVAGETARVAQNTALALRQVPPQAWTSAVASPSPPVTNQTVR